MRPIAAAMCAALLGACAQDLPRYQPSNANILAIQAAGRSRLATGTFVAEPGHEAALNHLAIRASRLDLPDRLSFPDYIRVALDTDLQQSDRYDPHSPIVISGILQRNSIDASGINTATAEIAVHFTVKRDEQTRYDKVLTEQHAWESSFIGAIAIPEAVRNYGGTVSALIRQLFQDPEFQRATR